MTENEIMDRVPEAVVRRLPRYYRYLQALESMEEERVSSLKMSHDLGLNASQIRRDLNCFGGFGQQGYGYSVSKLKGEIETILGLNRSYQLIIAGVGNIGHALLNYPNFEKRGFQIAALFDIRPELIGKAYGNLVVQNGKEIETIAKTLGADIGVIATPKNAAQEVADSMVAAGVRGIWNFAPVEVAVRRGVCVENIHLNDSLYSLCYHMAAEDHLSELL